MAAICDGADPAPAGQKHTYQGRTVQWEQHGSEWVTRYPVPLSGRKGPRRLADSRQQLAADTLPCR